MNRLKESYAGCMNCGGKEKMKSGGKKKPNFNSSSLPNAKGIPIKPAKMRDTSPNFVNERKVEEINDSRGYRQRLIEDPGTNPGGYPVINYKPSVQDGSVNMRIMKSSGKFEYDKQGQACGLPSCDMPVKSMTPLEQYKNGGLKMKSGGKSYPKAVTKSAYSSTTAKKANLNKTLLGMRKAEDGMVNSNQPKPKPTLVVRWKDNVKNPENQEFVAEVAFNKKKGPNYDVSRQDIAKVTQEEFNQRYNIQKDSMVYPPKIVRKKLNKK